MISGSREVQSAWIATTPSVSNCSTTRLSLSATRLLTWQLRHQAAVKSTNTAFPDARRSCTSCLEKGSHCSPAPSEAAAPSEEAAAAVLSASAGAGTWLNTATMLAMMITAEAARAAILGRLPEAMPPQRPSIQLPRATITSRIITRATRLGSV